MSSESLNKEELPCPAGHKNPSYARFCGICGRRIEAAAAPAVEPVVKRQEFCFVGIGSAGLKVMTNLWRLQSRRGENRSYVGLDSDPPPIGDPLYPPGEFFHMIGRTSRGTGHSWKTGERLALEDSDLKKYLLDAGATETEAIFLTCSLGGGMGAGATPYLLSMLPNWGIRGARLILGVIPADDESDQLHFNAYCGLSKLIRYRSRYNSDLIILINNSNLGDYRTVDRKGKEVSGNEAIACVIDMMTSSGDAGVYRRINISDLVTFERSMKVFHFSPCLALSHSLKIYRDLTGVLEDAYSRPLMPLERGSALFTYLYLRLSESLKENLSYDDLLRECDSWRQRRLPKSVVSYLSLSYTRDKADKIDALLLVGGYPLDSAVARTREGYVKLKVGSVIPSSELETMEDTLREYAYNLKLVYQSAR